MNIKYGKNTSIKRINSLEDKYFVIVASDPPWSSFKTNLKTSPSKVIIPESVDIKYLEALAKQNFNASHVVGIGGGLAIDVAKFISWKKNISLIRIPSVISVDAFLTKEIGVRIKNRVNYIGNSDLNEIIIDYSLIQSAPPYLNYAGTCDVLSICSALGDWKIATDKFDCDIDKNIFRKAKELAIKMLENPKKVKTLSEKGIRFLVECIKEEYLICEEYGNSRPEEGGEHHLAYCIEKISPNKYIHGCLVGLNILVVLNIQGPYAVFDFNEIKNYFDEIGHRYKLKEIGISRETYKKALMKILNYVKKENLEKGVFWIKNILNKQKIEEIINWISRF
ncbi:MAG: iron-containing alcohol dehydrogenase [Promethearchaeota archaeon]